MKTATHHHLLRIAALIVATISCAPNAARAQGLDQEYTIQVLEKMTDYYQQGLDEKLYIQLDKPYYSSNDQIWLKGYLLGAVTNTSLNISNFIYVELIDSQDNLISRTKIRREESGFNGQITLEPKLPSGNYTLKGYTRWMLNKADEEFLFTKSIKIVSAIAEGASVGESSSPKPSSTAQAVAPALLDYSVEFFPEGGALLAGISQIVAFKALAEDGLSTEVSGNIYNSKGELIAPIKSSHKGMGAVAITASQGEEYYAIVESSEGLERRFALPPTDPSAAILTGRKVGNRLLFKVYSSQPEVLQGAHIVIHSHGRVVSATALPSSHTGAIAIENLFDGINVVSLVDSSNRVLSERLFFSRPSATPQIEITPNKENYAKREKASVKINIKNSLGEAVEGQWGVAVTDNSSVHFNAADDNIISNLLLTSDLSGYIESPGLYFDGDITEADRNIDLLMRTQGWRRFELEKVLSGEIEHHKLEYELAGEISGSVKGFFGREARKAQLHIICSEPHYVDSFSLDENNSFKLMGLDIPDSTTYVIQSRTRKGGNTLTLSIDEEYFPEPYATISPRPKQAYIPTAFVNQSQERFWSEGGMTMIDIETVYVTTTREESSSSFATRTTTREKLETMPALQLPYIIQMMPGMVVTTDGVKYRNSKFAPRFIVDGIDMEYDDISILTSNEIERIEFFSASDAAMYSNSGGGVFVIELLTGQSVSSSIITPGIAFVSQLGYQKEALFYQPHYHIESEKANLPTDNRTTLFWDGRLQCDTNGDIEFEFYTSDKATSYTITLEGVSSQGELFRATESVRRSAGY